MQYVTAVMANIGPSGKTGLLKINNRPMIDYVLDSVPDDTEKILILSRYDTMEEYREIAEEYDADVEETVDDSFDVRFQLEPIFKKVKAEGLLALSCNTPLMKREVLEFLRSIITNFSAAIPRPYFDKPEFIPAAYRVEPFRNAMEANPSLPMDKLVKHVKNILYLSAQSFKIFDDKLKFLTRVQNAVEARKAGQILQGYE